LLDQRIDRTREIPSGHVGFEDREGALDRHWTAFWLEKSPIAG
jgi:hypothetical protein